jgi:hypothetical protein
MRLEYELTKQDYIDFNIYYIKNSDTLKRSLIIQRYVMAVFFLIIPFAIYRVTDIPLWYWLAVFFVVAVLWVIFYPKYFMSATIKRISKLVDEGKNKDMLGKHIITVNEEGIKEESKNGDSRINWDGVEKVAEAENHIFIYISSVMAYIIPKSIFEDDNTRDEFLKLLYKKTEKDKFK